LPFRIRRLALRLRLSMRRCPFLDAEGGVCRLSEMGVPVELDPKCSECLSWL
jgi:hypothetical protein